MLAGPAKVILVVLPATEDFATQEALRIASKLDPTRSRTIGVLTKIDQDAAEVHAKIIRAQNEGFCSKLGFAAVNPI